MLAMLNEIPSVLVILNHPLWDIELVGERRHALLLRDFVRKHGRWIHAFEINGFRSWSENKAVIELAEALGIPVATGGDRHGCKPNTVINLTNASTFEEFVDEIRDGRKKFLSSTLILRNIVADGSIAYFLTTAMEKAWYRFLLMVGSVAVRYGSAPRFGRSVFSAVLPFGRYSESSAKRPTVCREIRQRRDSTYQISASLQ
jgi:hypothetical protein